MGPNLPAKQQENCDSTNTQQFHTLTVLAAAKAKALAASCFYFGQKMTQCAHSAGCWLQIAARRVLVID